MSKDTMKATREEVGEVNMEQRPVATCGYCGREMGKQECLYDHVVISGEDYVSLSEEELEAYYAELVGVPVEDVALSLPNSVLLAHEGHQRNFIEVLNEEYEEEG